MAESEEIERAGRALIEATPTPAKVILFGMHIGGDGEVRGAYEFLVIEREVEDRFGEMARLGTILGHLLIPAQVVVASEEEVRRDVQCLGSHGTTRVVIVLDKQGIVRYRYDHLLGLWTTSPWLTSSAPSGARPSRSPWLAIRASGCQVHGCRLL